MSIGQFVGALGIIAVILFLSVIPLKSHAFEQSFCSQVGNTQSCTNYHTDSQTGNTTSDQSITYYNNYNQAPGNQNRGNQNVQK